MYPIVEKKHRNNIMGAFVAGVLRGWSNRPYAFPIMDKATFAPPSQIRTRPVPMTEEEVRTIRKETGKGPYFEKKFVPVAKGRPRSQTRKKAK